MAEMNDKIFDAMLKVAVEEAVEQEMAALGDINMPITSTMLDERVRRIISKEKRNATISTAVTKNPRLVMAAVAAVLFVLVLGFDALISRQTPEAHFIEIEFATLDADIGGRMGIETLDLEFELDHDISWFDTRQIGGFNHVMTEFHEGRTAMTYVNDEGVELTFNRFLELVRTYPGGPVALPPEVYILYISGVEVTVYRPHPLETEHRLSAIWMEEDGSTVMVEVSTDVDLEMFIAILEELI